MDDARSATAAAPTFHLSPRETEVLRLICSGLSTNQIVVHLGITFKTAMTHRVNLMRKTQCHGLALLVQWAIRSKLAEP